MNNEDFNAVIEFVHKSGARQFLAAKNAEDAEAIVNRYLRHGENSLFVATAGQRTLYIRPSEIAGLTIESFEDGAKEETFLAPTEENDTPADTAAGNPAPGGVTTSVAIKAEDAGKEPPLAIAESDDG